MVYLFGQFVGSSVGGNVERASGSDHVVSTSHLYRRKARPVGIKD